MSDIKEPKKTYCQECKHLGNVTKCRDYPTRRICNNDSFCKLKQEDPYRCNKDNDCTKFEKSKFVNFWETVWTYVFFAGAVFDFFLFYVNRDYIFLGLGIFLSAIFLGRIFNQYIKETQQ